MKQESKLSVAMEIIETQIGECMIKLRNSNEKELQEKYQDLISKREEIYNGNNDEIDKIIKEARK